MSDLPYQAEYAKTGRASCKGCKTQIPKDSVRLAVMVQSAFFDGKQANWFHEKCFFQKQRPQSIDEFSNIISLRAPDQKRIKESIENVGSGVVLPIADVAKPKKGKGTKRANDDTTALKAALKDFSVEYSKSSRATCRRCEIKICKEVPKTPKLFQKLVQKNIHTKNNVVNLDCLLCEILKGEVRVCKVVFDTEIGQKYGGQPLWHHVNCFAEERLNHMYWASGELLPGFKSLKAEDQEMVKKEIPDKPLCVIPVKKLKTEPKDEAEVKQDKELEKKMDAQNKLFFKYRDGLQKSGLRKAEFQEILEFNLQGIPTGNDKVLDLLADSMAFGSLKPCSECKEGQLTLNTSGYVCTGNLTEWTKCTNVTQKPDRIPFKVPEAYKELSIFRRFKPKVVERLFLTAPKPSTSFIKTEPELTKVKPEMPVPPLKNLKFFIFGRTIKNKEDLKHRILKLGGLVPSKLDDSIIAVVSTQVDVDTMSNKMEEIQGLELQVVTEDYVTEVEKEKCTVKRSVDLIVEHNIAVWGADPFQKLPKEVLDGKSIPKSGSIYVKSEKSGVTKLKLKGGTAVDPDSNLEDVAHVLIDRNGTKWTVVLGLTDIVAQKNSYYKLQLLESDNQKKYWLFRSWGRIGTTIGGTKLEAYGDLYTAKNMFEILYTDKTANKWDAGDNFVKVPGKMCPIDVDYHDGGEEEIKIESNEECKLPMPVQSLVKLIFDIKLMKQVLLEFELDTEKMPLGKLSKKQITAGYKVLKEVIKLIEDARKKNKNPDQNRVIDATNRFYTLIPHDFGVQNPPLLDSTEAITTKTQMLDSLLEIEIAYSLLKTESDDNKLSPIEAHYMKLKTEIVPMDKKSPEYELLSKYVHNTHAKTHSQYTITINQIFKVVREGEEKRYKPFKKLHNRRLLWHGSRVTNFAGILSQGLRIAPPEAPVTGYMFGKGIYFADMVSKSANYCYTNQSSPTGVMLLCEVALGNMEECLQATSFSKAPFGKHSVWGMGRTEPDPAQNHVMDDGIIIPMGTPVDKNISSSLLYNEFIIYDVAQVKVRYLFEMQFNYKY